MSRWEPLLEQLVRERHGALLARALMLTGHRAEAEDLLQDALVATFSSRARFTSMAAAEQYVRRAIVTRSVDQARSRASERRALDRLRGMPEPVVPDVAVTGLERDLVVALQTLTPRQRACLVLRHVEDMSVAETAAALGLSDGAVKRYTSDGARALNATLGTAGPHGADPEPVLLVTDRKGDRDA
jgi:RNA polymerase sigma factor (sigma-70 family)